MDRMLARRGAQREEPFLGALELLWIKGRRGDRRFQRPAGLLQSPTRARSSAAIVSSRSPPASAPLRSSRRRRLGECRDRRSSIRPPFHRRQRRRRRSSRRASSAGAGRPARSSSSGCGRSALQLIDGGAKIVRFRPRGRDPFLQLGDRRRGLLPGAMGVGDRRGFAGRGRRRRRGGRDGRSGRPWRGRRAARGSRPAGGRAHGGD